tara:strand:- start:118 stop:444 length:327 start_codon:yes stop_codon:yes gene_type:complete
LIQFDPESPYSEFWGVAGEKPNAKVAPSTIASTGSDFIILFIVMSRFLTNQKQENRLCLSRTDGVEMPTLKRVFGFSLWEAHWVLASLLPQAIKRNESLLLYLTFEVF